MGYTRLQRQRGLQFAKALSELAARAPSDGLKSATYRVANDARMEFGYSWEEKKAEIVRCVKLGASTRDDLARETPFNKQEICELLNDLDRAGIIRVASVQLNRTGPKLTQYFPVDPG